MVPFLPYLGILLAVLVCLQRTDKWAKCSLKATCDWRDAEYVLYEWRCRNPGVYIGLSSEGRQLVARCIETYREFIATHSYIDGTDHLEWLKSLFGDLPPKHRKCPPRLMRAA